MVSHKDSFCHSNWERIGPLSGLNFALREAKVEISPVNFGELLFQYIVQSKRFSCLEDTFS